MSRHNPTEALGPRLPVAGPAGGKAVGILGGTFDPVHVGHLRIALDAREALGLDHVRLIPLADPVHRARPVASNAQRLAMLEAATAGRAELLVDDRELRRDGPSYTVDTLASLRTELPDSTLCLLLGDDAFAGFPAWRAPDRILQLANIAVLQRPGHGPANDPAVHRLLYEHQVDRLQRGAAGQILLCPVTQLEIASSDLRRRIAAGRSIDYLVPMAVNKLIREQGLYR